MKGEFFIGDKLGTKASLSWSMNIYFMGAEEKEDGIWSVNLGYGNSVGQGGFGLNSLLSVKKGNLSDSRRDLRRPLSISAMTSRVRK